MAPAGAPKKPALPTKAGTHFSPAPSPDCWIPAYAGNSDFIWLRHRPMHWGFGITNHNTSWVWVTSATSLPSAVVTRVCHTIVRRPRCNGVAVPVTRLPGGAERVGEGHDRPAMQHRRPGAEVIAHHHVGDHLLRRGLGEFNADQLGKR